MVEKHEVEREAHAKGVHAGAARNQQARACLLTVEVSEAEQARLEPRGDRDLAPQNHGGGLFAETTSSHCP